jgi:hypothetical protein
MKTGRLFWAALFIVIGLLGLLHNLSLLSFEWHFVWKLWPLALIMIGLATVLKDPRWRGALVAAAGVFVALVIFSSFQHGSREIEHAFADSGDGKYETQKMTESFLPSISRASLHFDAGAGSFEIGDTTGDLIAADIETSVGRYNLTRTDEDSLTRLDLSMKDSNVHWRGNMHNSVDVRLHPDPEWDMDFDIGAAKMDFDLRAYKTRSVVVNSGASSIDLKLGDRADLTNVEIKTGVSKIDVDVPNNVDCQITTDAELSSKDFIGFKQIDTHVYQSENYGSSKKKMFINIEAGLSSIRVERSDKSEW